jgi:hypothetical protein
VAGMTFTAMRLTKPYLIYDKTSIALQQDMFFRHGVNIENLTINPIRVFGVSQQNVC